MRKKVFTKRKSQTLNEKNMKRMLRKTQMLNKWKKIYTVIKKIIFTHQINKNQKHMI